MFATNLFLTNMFVNRLTGVLWSHTRILFEQPGLAQSVLVTRSSGPAYLSLADGILALLSTGGVPPGQAAWAVDLLLADQRNYPDAPAGTGRHAGRLGDRYGLRLAQPAPAGRRRACAARERAAQRIRL
jgi:hypothetical protein